MFKKAHTCLKATDASLLSVEYSIYVHRRSVSPSLTHTSITYPSPAPNFSRTRDTGSPPGVPQNRWFSTLLRDWALPASSISNSLAPISVFHSLVVFMSWCSEVVLTLVIVASTLLQRDPLWGSAVDLVGVRTLHAYCLTEREILSAHWFSQL